MVYLGLHEGDASRGYVPELRRIASETPVYPRSKKIDEKVVLKQSMAYLFVSYTTPVAFDEIESFYKRELPARGWALPKGPSGRFIEDLLIFVNNPKSGSRRLAELPMGLWSGPGDGTDQSSQ